MFIDASRRVRFCMLAARASMLNMFNLRNSSDLPKANLTAPVLAARASVRGRSAGKQSTGLFSDPPHPRQFGRGQIGTHALGVT
jgi:hypothetical protein